MPMDGLTLGFVAREMEPLLLGGRIDKVTQPEKDTLILWIRAGSENRRLLLCASPNNARCHLTAQNFPNPLEPPMFCMLLRKQLLGGRVLSLKQIGGDRVLHLAVDTVNELGDHVQRLLILEVMGRHSNLILVDEQGRIIDAARVRLKQPEEKFPLNVQVRGNTSSASVPILLDEVSRAGRLRPGDILAMSAFGAGLTTGACVLRWTKE